MKKKKGTKKTKKKKKMQYKKLDSISHILCRPDMYIGTNQDAKEDVFLYDDMNSKIMYHKDVIINDGILRCFTEVISNSIDNFFRSKDGQTPMKKLEIKYDKESNYMEVCNDGNHIPIEIHPEEKIYVPEMIFGHLLSGSNYNDSENRIVSGRNGLGIKLLNVFSKEFKIECYDIEKELVYKQTWKNNMRECKSPRITEKKKTEKTASGYTKIKFQLDLSKFRNQDKSTIEYETFHENTISAFKKLLVDASFIMGIPVIWNKEKYHVKKVSDYGKLLSSEFDKKFCIEGEFMNSQVEYCILPFQTLATEHITFVNGIYTKEGGYHLDLFYQKLFPPMVTKLKKYSISMKDLKKHFTIIMKVFVANPAFSSQSKTKLVSSKTDLGKWIEFEDKMISKILKWDFVNQIKEDFDLKEELSLKKTEKKRGFKKIDGYDKANLSNTKRSQECSLILCEGLSAKTFATKGISKGLGSKKGRDFFGIYPLRGKVLNVRNSTSGSISSNREITDIIQCLNLKFGLDYTEEKNFETLSYGRIIILTDADVDGMHICGLLLNVFHKLFPSLLNRSEPFIRYMMTPVAKMRIGREETITFYNDFEYQQKLEEVENSKRKFEVKYYKGLGTSNDTEIRETFGEKVVNMVLDTDSQKNMDLVFHKNLASERKDWLLTIDESKYNIPEKDYHVSTFLNQDFIKFSIDDCKRSIPCIYDGLKNSQRKILYAVFKKNLQYSSKSLKVAQLAAFTAECSLYHHGEQNLSDTIVKLAQDYVGSNNVNLLFPDGQFGSRIENGKDAASSRYIYTKLMKHTPFFFREEDTPLLQYAYEDGTKVEPEFYLPIVPMILVNGCRAIGTGWSSFIPNFRLDDILRKLNLLLDEDMENFNEMELAPYYKGFKGSIEKIDDNKYITRGILEMKVVKNKKNYVVREIPIGESIDGYKSYCEKLVEDKVITNLKNYSNDKTVHFEFQKCETTSSSKKDFTLETLKLTSNLSLTNMVLFTNENKIRKYKSVDEIILDFFHERLDFYQKRIHHVLQCLKKKKVILENKAKFLLHVVEQKIILFNKNNSEIISQLEEMNFVRIEKSFDYLLSMPIRTITKEKYNLLLKEISDLADEIKRMEKISPKQLWKQELREVQEL
jgi:DNA topoisomerase II